MIKDASMKRREFPFFSLPDNPLMTGESNRRI